MEHGRDFSTGRGIGYTLDLTAAFQDGEISADDYIEERAKRIGRPNLIHGIVLPFCDSLRSRFRRPPQEAE